MRNGIVHVVDDDQAVCDSLRFMLEASGLPVRTYAGAGELLAADLSETGCVVTDFQMPDMDGLQLQAQLSARAVQLPVIVMTAHGDVSSAIRAMKAGAVDFLQKPFAEPDLLDAVRRALDRNRQPVGAATASGDAARQLSTLTAREHEVLELLVEGRSTKEIGKLLGASPRTIDVHRGRVFHKLHASNLPHLVHLVLSARAAKPNV